MHRRTAVFSVDVWRAPARLPGAALAFVLAACASVAAPDRLPPDVTAAVIPLGNPFVTGTSYSRNVWDMQLFGGVIHLGHGDSIDNLGPIPIWSIDPATGALANEFTTSEEQVDEFRVLNGQLYVPGHDPRDDLTMGNFYRVEAGAWAKHRTIPWGLHTFDLAWHGGRLFAALGADSVPGHVTLQVSADAGATWAPASPDLLGRVYELFELNGTLYGAPSFWPGRTDEERRLLRWDGARFVRTDAQLDSLYLGIHGSYVTRMVRPTEFAGSLVYVVALSTFDWMPEALAVSSDAKTARRVAFPDAGAVPYDLLVRGGTLYVLTATRQGDEAYVIRVYATTDLVHWTERFHLSATTFARSFEESGGDFFLGLGCDYQKSCPASGNLLRVTRASYAN